jgi:GTP-binding protein
MELVAIVGRPNVGKSALFNRLVGKPLAIVSDRSGVTRDRHTGVVEWGAWRFWVADTGGFEPAKDPGQAEADIRELMHSQVRLAVEEAGRIVFLVDGQAGIQPGDRTVAQLLRRSGKPVLVAVNKVDTPKHEEMVWEFSELGLGDPIAVSAVHGLGVDELCDQICAGLPRVEAVEEDDDTLRVALVGRPNVGKSSLVNQLLGREAMVVYDQPGTTRDSVDIRFEYQGKPYTLVDTAGLKEKGKIADEVEKYASVRALRSIKDCDVAVLVLDAQVGVTEQDERIAGLIHEAGRGCLIAVNKWDLLTSKDNQTFNACLESVRARLNFLDYAPVVFVSAKTRQRLSNLMELVAHVGEQHCMRISTGVLNRALEDFVTEMPPPTRHGKSLKLFFLSQTGVKPPAFALFVNDPALLHFSYMRHLKNRMRTKFGFEGTPLFVMLRRRK